MFDGLFDKPWLILVIVILFVLMFGSRKLPGAARSLGQSMRILKKEVSGLHEEDEHGASSGPATADATPAVAPAQLQAPPATPAATPAAPDAQAQIAALQEQLNSLQQTVGANGTTATDSKQTR
ncbi:MAG TPA: Sec-independent protein translocase subunit TatA [Trebonia sp.]|nr:Sec-independent protein translocase subunit TatA [Trebonia sp.]